MQCVKKFILALLIFLGVVCVFHKQIVGASIRVALRWYLDCEFAYRSVAWDEGKFTFTDFVIFDSHFYAHVEQASLQFDFSQFPRKCKGHLHFNAPHIARMSQKEWPKLEEGWFDFSVSVQDGVLNWEGPVHFSLSYAQEKTEVVLHWDTSGALLTKQEGRWEAEFTHFRACLLKPFVPSVEILDGEITGRISLDQEEQLLFANVKLAHLGLMAPLGSMEEVEGTVSYSAKLGAKWEVKGIGCAQGTHFPFRSQGRGFFKSHWVESEVQFGSSGVVQLDRKNQWNIQCQDVNASEIAWIAAGAALFWPELEAWHFEKGSLTGSMTFASGEQWKAEMVGKGLKISKQGFPLFCDELSCIIDQDGGAISCKDQDYALHLTGKWDDWHAKGQMQKMQAELRGKWDGAKFIVDLNQLEGYDLQFTGKGWIDTHFDGLFSLKGKWRVAGQDIPLTCPILSKQGSLWSFDFRSPRPAWDLFRIVGTWDGSEIEYSPLCRFCNEPIAFAQAPLGDFDLAWQCESLDPLQPWLDSFKVPHVRSSPISCHLQYRQDLFTLHATSDAFTFLAKKERGDWCFDLKSLLNVEARLQPQGNLAGKLSWKEDLAFTFDGKIDPTFSKGSFALPNVRCNLSALSRGQLEGIIEGQGHISLDDVMKADFDCTTSPLKLFGKPVENRGSLHFYYSSDQGGQIRGLELHGAFDCIVDLVEYDMQQSLWKFHHAQGSIEGIDFLTDCEVSSDLSTGSCTVYEGTIPLQEERYHVENLFCSWDQGRYIVNLQELYQLEVDWKDCISGRLTLGKEAIPLAINWEYKEGLMIESIEGSFAGVDASFHREDKNTLVGSASVNFTAISPYLPQDIAKVFEKIKMGDGYELKGRIRFDQNIPSFQGILCGKQMELFGFQFRTLLAQVSLSHEKVHIYDLMISDSAGRLIADQILLEGKKNVPWTISIPSIFIREFRPSLLHKPHAEAGPMNPLVVREMHITDLTGLLDEPNTYTANGNLHFINSYKRESTVFDIPANFLNRIVGLDFELLIPVIGDVEFELKEGFCYLAQLKDSYSEAMRSEFFLEMDPPPRMDLDGNLEILIKMKQFVLFKFTESFLISVEGNLADPQFSLRRRRFFGLMQ